jgi:universal stress protein E
LLAEQQGILDRAVAPMIEGGVEVNTEVEWDEKWCAAVIRASVKSGADLVMKSTFKHSASKRVLNKTCDITLIRGCLCPVLMVKEGGSRDVRRVLAAVDVRARTESYERLNQNVFDFSKRIADSRCIEVHYINAFQDFKSVPSKQELLDNHDVEGDKIHIKLGDPDKVIVELAKELDVDLVVLGNSARSGLPAAFLGNTVEKVLDKLECDVLSMP